MTAGIDPSFAHRLRQMQSATPSLALATRDLPRRGDFARLEVLARTVPASAELVPAVVTGVQPDVARRFLRQNNFLRSDVRRAMMRNGSGWLARHGFVLLRGNPSVEVFEWLADSLGGYIYDGQVQVGLPTPPPVSTESPWDWQGRAIGDNERLLNRRDLGRGVSIAILDSGVAARHAAFAGEPVLEMDFTGEGPGDRNGHGTHCCGIAAGAWIELGDGRTFRGIAPAARRLSGKCLDRNGRGTWTGVIQAVAWAAEQRADIVSMSLGSRSDGRGRSPVAQVVDKAVESGCVVVVAAGNEGPGRSTISTPGDARLAITVGAHDKYDAIAPFSSRGPTAVPGKAGQKPDLVAPGVQIVSAAPSRRANDRPMVSMSGTSMATPVVAGLCAALVSLDPNLRRKPEDVRKALVAMCRNLGDDPLAYGAGAPCLARSPIAQKCLTPARGGPVMFGTLARAAAVVAFGAGCAVAGAHLGRDIRPDRNVLATAHEIGARSYSEVCTQLCASDSDKLRPPAAPTPTAPPVRNTPPPDPDRGPAPDTAHHPRNIAADPHLSPTERNRRMREALLARP